MNKYPFVVTVFRRAGTTRPAIQQYNFEDIGIAHMEMGKIANDRSVFRLQLSAVLKEVTYWGRKDGPV